MKATSGTSRRLPTGLHRSGGDGGCTFGHWGGRQRIVGVLHWTVMWSWLHTRAGGSGLANGARILALRGRRGPARLGWHL